MVKRNKGPKAGAYFSFTQTANPNNIYAEAHIELLFFVFELFRNHSSFLIPGSNWAISKNKYYPYLYFNTNIEPFFTELYNNCISPRSPPLATSF